MNPKVSQYFTDIVSISDENINLAEAHLYLCLNFYPDLEPAKELERIQGMTRELKKRISGLAEAREIIHTINDYLFSELGFRGNWQNFNDPRNSFLNQVLERKLGIPISLSVLYMELGRQLSLPIYGISFPGHFLVKLNTAERDYIIDVFAGGLILTESEIHERLDQFSNSHVNREALPALLKGASNMEILNRTLRNLKHIYLDAQDYESLLDILSLQMILDSQNAELLRERACVFEQLDCFRAAHEDFQRYLREEPDAKDHRLIQDRLLQLQHSINNLH